MKFVQFYNEGVFRGNNYYYFYEDQDSVCCNEIIKNYFYTRQIINDNLFRMKGEL